MNGKISPAILFILLVCVITSTSSPCSWTRKTVRILVVLDEFDKEMSADFQNATSTARLNSLYDHSDICVPNIKFNMLSLNGSSDEITTIQKMYQSFSKHAFCTIILASRSRKSYYILEYAKLQQIPVISIVPKTSNFKSESIWKGLPLLYLNSHESVYDKTHSIAPILKKLNLKKIVVIYDNSVENMQATTYFKRSLALNNILLLNSTLVTEQTDIQLLTARIKAFKTIGSTFVLLTNKTSILDAIFEIADFLHMLGPAFSWVIFSDTNDNYSPPFSVQRELLVVSPRSHQWQSRDLIHDAVFLVTKGLDSIAKAEEKGKCSCRCECKPFTNQLYRCLLQVKFKGAAGLVMFDEEGERKYTQYDIIVLVENEYGQYIREIIGNWNGNAAKLIPHQTRPTFRALVNEYPPNVMALPKLKDKPCPQGAEICRKNTTLPNGKYQSVELCCYGFAIDVLNLIKEEIGFDADIRFSGDGQYGVYNTVNDSWNGIVSELLENKGDVTLDLYVSARRAKVLDFTEPYAPSGIRLLVKEYSKKGTNIYWLSYLRPFTTTVWLTLLGSVGVMIIFLWLVEKCAPNRNQPKCLDEQEVSDVDKFNEEEFQKFLLEEQARGFDFYDETLPEEEVKEEEETNANKKQPTLYGPFGLDNAVCFTLALAFGRPADEAKPLLNGARLASVAFGVAMLMLVSSYSANLAAFLIVDEKFTSVENIYDEKIGHPPPGFRYGTLTGSYMADFFANADNAYMKSMWYNMKKNNVDSVSEGVKKVKTGELDVFIADHISLAYESLNDPTCELKVVGDPFAMSGAAIAVKKGSPLFASFNDVLQRLKSKGLTDFIQKFWVTKYKCFHEKPPSQLKIQDLSGLFLQLAIAVVACFLGTFLNRAIKVLVFKYKMKRKRTNSMISQNSKLRMLVKSLETKV
ncbi:hypothetical protein QZH41_017384 [Actinostola sp. cb2023]|nr:hypothetical protein QZH41_017384 [Actinostola sp. cb2023]